MLKEILGIRTGILEDIHNDHREADQLLEKIFAARTTEKRSELFRTLNQKLLVHLEAETKVLYRKMLKAAEKEVREFPLEGTIEHDIVIDQLGLLSRGRDQLSEEWTARLTVLQELIHHHVKEEESEGFEKARKIFDDEALERLGDEFKAEKERLAEAPESKPARRKSAARG